MPSRLVPLSAGPTPAIALNRPVLLVGRHPECDVRIDLPHVSRRHCCVALVGERVVLRDLGSAHGLWINGRRIEEETLEPGDEVAIGALIYRYEGTATTARVEAAPAAADPVPTFLPAPDGPAHDSDDHLPQLPVDLGDDFSIRG
jgi:predicted component of type VI protein secretion system